MMIINPGGPPRRSPHIEDDEKFRLKKLFTSFKILPRVLGLVWDAHPWLLLAMAFVTLLSAFVPVAQVILVGLLIDRTLEAITHQTLDPIWFPVILQLIISLLNQLLLNLDSLIQALLQDRVSSHIQLMILQKADTLDLSFFEDPDFYDTLRYASQESQNRPITMITQTFNLCQTVVTLLSLCAFLFRLSWWIALVGLVIPIPSFIANAYFGLKNYWMLRWQSPEKRQQLYLNSVMTTDEYNKEVKLFNLGAFFTKRYKDLADKFYYQNRGLQAVRSFSNFFWTALSVIANSIMYLYIAYLAVLRIISLGALSQFTLAVTQAGQQFQNALNGLTSMYEHTLYIDNLFTFLTYQPKIVSPLDPEPIAVPVQQSGLSIEFRNVSFTYPGKTEPALKNVSFLLRAGETIALVGRNGAGKTTLVKLLTRLYDPDEGEVLIGGKNVKAYSIYELREHIGVIFQDFVKYNLTVQENIGVGKVSEFDNRSTVRAAAQKSGADEVISRLDDGYQSLLGHWFGNGVQLSGGEWQKIALARAFIRDAPILVLDEPTSALDAKSEYDIFTRFHSLTSEKTTLFISHRFSTVRLADRIFLLDNGAIIESGSHQDLLKLDGQYAELFNLQAEAYR
ncbi:multidrug ABC transporter permease [Dictyobacter alpinus]|uniref:Multidrug ABC transporter permease n=1 Tax=Dictyobacter alpinus TaxID=2014873 RepID=A0A402BDY2_9CHLR|nr:ABC transporter ATP-binding protein [Dictyobacter alpinus]GCE29584.1 multidrug ABC transporter permease [Dictyobacter alpinus]